MGDEQRTADWAALHHPGTDAAELARIAAARPEFAEAVGAHPNAYPALRAWVADTTASLVSGYGAVSSGSGTALTTATAAAHDVSPSQSGGATDPLSTRRRGLLWIAAAAASAAAVAIVALLLPIVPNSGWLAAIAPILPFAVVAGITAPGAGRKIVSIICAVLAMLAMFMLFGLGAFIVPPLLSLVYLLGRPIRGFGWFSLFLLLPSLFMLCYTLFSMRFFGFGDGVGQNILVVAGSLVVLGAGIFLAERLSGVSVQRIAAREAELANAQSLTGVDANLLAVVSMRTNTLAILALIFAFFGSVLGIVFGHVALSQIKRTGEQGRGLAVAGLVIGYVSLGIGVIAGIVSIVVILVST